MASRGEKKGRDPDVGMLCAQLLTAFQRELHSTADKSDGTRPRHGAVMAYLDFEGTRATELAERSGQHKQAIGTLIDELVELGLVERQPDPNDRRAKLIVPTERGAQQMKNADAAAAAIEARYAKGIGDQQYADFKHIFRDLLSFARDSG